MHPGPHRAAQILIQRLAEQGMHETGPAPGMLQDQPAAAEALRCHVGFGLAQPGHLCGKFQREAGAQHRRRLGAAQARHGKSGKARQQQAVPDPARGRPGRLGQVFAAANGDRDLLQQQRIPGAQPEGPAADLGGYRPADPRRQQGARSRIAQRGEPLERGAALVGQALRGLQCLGRPRAHRSQDPGRRPGDPPADKAEQGEGVRVCPVQVIENEQGPRAGALLKPAEHAIEPRRPVDDGRARRRVRQQPASTQILQGLRQ